MTRRSIQPIVIVAALACGSSARGQDCPATYASCDNGACCPSHDQCCPSAAEGCCSSYAPYCCGDGTCAVSPSACGDAAGATTACSGYDLPCGGACIPAGAECCDANGHYCPPGSTCASGTVCSTDDASLRVAPMAPAPSPPQGVSPLADPSGASARSCAIAPITRGSSFSYVLAAGCALGCLERRRKRSALRKPWEGSAPRGVRRPAALAVAWSLASGCADQSQLRPVLPAADAGVSSGGDAVAGEDSGSSQGLDASSSDASVPSADGSASADGGGVDRFGITEVHPTKAGGREWYLPDTADQVDPTHEWQPEAAAMPITKTPGSPPYFTTGVGDPCGQVRLDVTSPAGKAWWKNVEMTWYVRYERQQGDGAGGSCGQWNHWELHARGERHSASTCAPASINDYVAAPAGTHTWPGYPFSGVASLSEHCLGTAYHGNYYTTGRYLFEKEITHTAGYATQLGDPGPRWDDATHEGNWIGMKWVVQNVVAGQVALELWLDETGTGQWVQAVTQVDSGSAWTSPTIDSACGGSPFDYTTSMLIDWAGPWVTFRSDDMVMDFKQASVREIDGL